MDVLTGIKRAFQAPNEKADIEYHKNRAIEAKKPAEHIKALKSILEKSDTEKMAVLTALLQVGDKDAVLSSIVKLSPNYATENMEKTLPRVGQMQPFLDAVETYKEKNGDAAAASFMSFYVSGIEHLIDHDPEILKENPVVLDTLKTLYDAGYEKEHMEYVAENKLGYLSFAHMCRSIDLDVAHAQQEHNNE